jgi:chemotaxis protein MotA
MDIATVIGLALGGGLVVGAIVIGGGNFAAFIDPSSILVVLGGSIAATLVAFPLKSFLGLLGVAKKAVVYQLESIPELIRQIVTLAETARRDGLLALESRLKDVRNPFMVMGVQMAVDGTRPEVMEDILRIEMDAVSARHRDGKAVLDGMGRFAPAFGMIGTLIGLIMMLGDMSDPSGIGKGMAVALLTTLYGAVASYAVFLPMAEKLSFINKQELLAMEVILRGIMAIQAGENPRVIEQKLNTFLSPKARACAQEAA